MKLFIGNLGTEIASHDLLMLFMKYGEVAAATAIKEEGRPLGYGYVLMKNARDAKQAIRALDKKKFMDQYLVVNEAIYSADTVTSTL